MNWFNIVQRYFHKIVPEQVRWNLAKYIKKYKTKTIASEASTFLSRSENDEFKQIGLFFKKNGLEIFPYEFIKKYKPKDIIVYFDDSSGLNYVLLNGNRLYAKRGMLPSKIKTMINSLLLEQDFSSPHLYVTQDAPLKNESVIYDVGAAEGIFTLMHIDSIRKAYLFEADQSWIEALEYTFRPWKNKISIVNKYVGKEDAEPLNLITLDTFAKKHSVPDFIKADIEGAEIDMLTGANNIFSTQNNLAVSICTYHNESDATKIENVLKQNNFSTQFSQGYILCQNQPPYLRKGLIRGQK